jgi:hypothetical protein
MGRWKREASDRLRFRNIHHSNPTNPQSDPHHAPTDPPTLSFIVVFDILYRISNHEFHFKRNSSISYLAPAAECWEHQTIKFLSIPPMFLATPITFAYLFHLPMSPFLQIFLRLDYGKVEEHCVGTRTTCAWVLGAPAINLIRRPQLSLATPITFAYLFHLPMSPFLQIFLRLDHGKVEERGFRSLTISQHLPRCHHSNPTNPQSDSTMHLPTLQPFLSS